MPTHFHSSDERFCGSRKQCRKFTFDPNAVTCPACKSRDRLWLTPQGQALVDGLNAAAGRAADPALNWKDLDK